MGLLGEFGQIPPANLNRTEPLLEIFTLIAGDTTSPTRVGFFGINKPPSSPVIIGQYQTFTFRTGHFGTDQGEMINVQYKSSTTATVSGTHTGGFGFPLDQVNINTIPAQSGTLLLRFKDSNDIANVTQNGVFRAINLTSASGAADTSTAATGVLVYAAQLADTHGNSADSTWTQIGGTGSPGDLNLNSQAGEASVHDFNIIISTSAENIGTKRDWGFYVSIEAL